MASFLYRTMKIALIVALLQVASAIAATQYDYQIILMMQPDETVQRYAAALYGKHLNDNNFSQTMLQWNTEVNFEGYTIVEGVKDFQMQLHSAQKVRIYVVAHGSDGTELGTCNAREIGSILSYLIGGKAKNVGRISLVSCSIHDSTAPMEASFASQLLSYLYNNGITTEISARTVPVAVTSTGQKVTKKRDKFIHKAKNSKIVAYMNRGKVAIKEVEYSKDEVDVQKNFQALMDNNGQWQPTTSIHVQHACSLEHIIIIRLRL